MQKIRYRLVYNYSGKTNKIGEAPVSLECRQGKKKMYISSQVMITPDQWKGGRVVNHPNAHKLTAYLYRWKSQIEEIELDALLKGRHLTLYQLKTAIRSGTRSNATIAEFVKSVICNSSRKKATKQGYRYLANDIERLFGRITLTDITYDLIERYRTDLKNQSLSDNTIKGRLKQLRCIVNEAMKRNLITDDPFKNITIGNMTPRKNDYLDASDVLRLEKARLTGREAHIMDAFLFCVYTGLRFGDFIRLKSENIVGNRLIIEQQKTGGHLELPIKSLFGGKAMEILSKYPSVESFANIGHNSTANKTLKEIGAKVHLKKNLHWHKARKTCATLLNQAGLKMQEISYILGQTRTAVTEKFYATTAFKQVEKSLKRVYKNW